MPARQPRRRRHPAPESSTVRALGERIRAARQAAHLSQTQLGKPHFTRAYVSAVELGKIRPSMKSLEFLAQRLGRPMSSFLEDADGREREFARLRADEAALKRARAEALSPSEAVELANGPGDLPSLADRESARAEARYRAGDVDTAVELMRGALALRRAA